MDEKEIDSKIEAIIALLIKRDNGTITPAEAALLDEQVREDLYSPDFLQRMDDPDFILGRLQEQEQFRTAIPFADTEARAAFRDTKITAGGGTRSFLSRWSSYVAIAATVLVAVAGWVFWINRSADKTNNASGTYAYDVEPGKDRAIWITGDQEKIDLDSLQEGSRTIGNLSIHKKGNLVTFKARAGDDHKAAVWNTVQTPRGGRYRVELPDGSLAYLNAASSIRFPSFFATGNREITVTGEVYLEVAKKKLANTNQRIPFICHIESNTFSHEKMFPLAIEVKGTTFNVNAYPGNEVTTSLLEGHILFHNGTTVTDVQPGQQVQALETGNTQRVPQPDLDAATAWRDGRFIFDNASLDRIMQSLERWYNVDVTYQDLDPSDYRFTVWDYPQDVPLSKFLGYMEAFKKVTFDILPGNRVVVSKMKASK